MDQTENLTTSNIEYIIYLLIRIIRMVHFYLRQAIPPWLTQLLLSVNLSWN